MAIVLLACGAVAIAAVWRCTNTLGLVGQADEGGLDDAPEPQLALPSGPSNEADVLDDMDRALWELIEAEYRRSARGAIPAPAPAPAALLPRRRGLSHPEGGR